MCDIKNKGKGRRKGRKKEMRTDAEFKGAHADRLCTSNRTLEAAICTHTVLK